MSITENENLLFDEWRQVRDGFVADGVVDEESYVSSNPKLMFILKEVNDPGGGNWDLREFIREGARPQTWDNVTRWAEGIRSLPSEVAWINLAEVTKERRCLALKSICAINLKKSPGGHTTINQDLWEIAAQDKEFINKQYALYDPDIIICCGSAAKDVFHWVLDFHPTPEWSMTKRGIWFHVYSPGKHLVSYAHPEARVADCLLYYGLLDALKEILF